MSGEQLGQRAKRTSGRLAGAGLALAAVAAVGGSASWASAATILGSINDQAVSGPIDAAGTGQDANGSSLAAIANGNARAGSNTEGNTNVGTIGKAFVVPFLLPTLPTGSTFTSASFTAYLTTALTGGQVYPSSTTAFTFNGDLYGLGVRSAATVATGDYFQGALDTTNATLLQDNYVTPASTPTSDATPVTTAGTSGTAIVNYLNTIDANNAAAGQYVFFRINADANSGATGDVAYTIYTADQTAVTVNGTAITPTPALTYTNSAVPEPATAGLATAAAAGALLRRRRSARA